MTVKGLRIRGRKWRYAAIGAHACQACRCTVSKHQAESLAVTNYQ